MYCMCVCMCVYSVTSRVQRVFHACNPSRLPSTCSRRVASRRANFRKAPRGAPTCTTGSLGSRERARARASALGRGTDSRNVVYDFHRPRAPFSILLNAPCTSENSKGTRLLGKGSAPRAPPVRQLGQGMIIPEPHPIT